MPDDILGKVINADTSKVSPSVETIIEGAELSNKMPSLQPKEESYKIYSGDAIAEDEINGILGQELVKFIVLCGLPKYGKTTLIATIFEHFLIEGQYCGYDFAGSRTLIGFDKRCYLSRISNSTSPETKHTTLGDNYYLDLSLVNQKTNKRERLIIVDTSGETFQKFQKSNLAVEEFNPLLRADHFTFIFDASLLNDKIEKLDAKDAALTIIRSIKENGMFTPYVNIEIVFSKWDTIEDVEAINGIKESIVEDIKAICKEYNLKDYVINSRSVSNSYDLDALFLYWLNADCVFEYQNKLQKETIIWEDDYLKYFDYGR